MRQLTREERTLVEAARDKAYLLYEGRRTPHRSCGICLAETFNLPTAAYQALRKGGISGEGNCGSIVAGQLVLGELFGDPDPRGSITDVLREAISDYDALWQARLGLTAGQIACNALVAPQGDFLGPRRRDFCTHLAATVAELVATVALAHGATITITPIADLEPES